MADDSKFILNVDDDWKRQAQEEKRRLAEQEQKAKAAAAPPPPAAEGAAPTITPEELEHADTPFATLVQTLLTQSLVYLGGMGSRGGQSMLNLDAAKRSLDMLGVLDDKCKGNLSDLEQKLLDTALYESRNRFVSVASQFIGP